MEQHINTQAVRETGSLARCNITGEFFDGRHGELEMRTSAGARFTCPTAAHSHIIFADGQRIGYEVVR